jgi:TolB-like protein/Tfp pilus assembly protein PilF
MFHGAEQLPRYLPLIDYRSLASPWSFPPLAVDFESKDRLLLSAIMHDIRRCAECQVYPIARTSNWCRGKWIDPSGHGRADFAERPLWREAGIIEQPLRRSRRLTSPVDLVASHGEARGPNQFAFSRLMVLQFVQGALVDMDRDTIFISHATPDDNEFVRWLADALTSRGYTVWADLLYLKGGTPFWTAIEETLRHRAIKVVFIVSRRSVDPSRSGVRNELSVADGLRVTLGDPGFIVPVRIDDTPFDALPIQIHQLNTLDFSKDRVARLPDLLDTLESGVVVPHKIATQYAASAAADVEPPSAEQAAGPAPMSPPLIAVLPFENISGDPEQDYFADGIVADMVTALSRFRSFGVIARTSSSVYKGRAVDVRDVGRHLGVSYLLEGSVRKAGASLRITAQLVDANSGTHLWAQNFDGTLEDVFAFQDRITGRVASIVEPMLNRAALDRLRLRPPSSLGVYDLYLQALAIVYLPEPLNNLRATELIEHALALDPEFAPALGVAASAYLGRWDRQLPGVTDGDRLRGLKYAHDALSVAGDDAHVRAVAGLALMTLGDEFDTGMLALRQAANENPNSVPVLAHTGIGAIKGGDLAEAESYLLRAISLNQMEYGGQWLLGGMAHVKIAQGDYLAALEWATRTHAVNQHNQPTHWMLAAANAYLGRKEEAKSWCDSLQALLPGTTIASIRRGQHMRDPRRIEVILDGLRLAGLPEGASA